MASELQIEPGEPVLLLEGESYDQVGRVIELFSTCHRSDRVALDITVMDPVIPTTDHSDRPPGSTTLIARGASGSVTFQQAEEAAAEALRVIQELRAAGERPQRLDSDHAHLRGAESVLSGPEGELSQDVLQA